MPKWVKGESGNPGGRPKGYGDVRELARQHTSDAVQTLVTIMNDPVAAPSARTSAASAILDRGWGKPSVVTERESSGSSFIEMLKQIEARRVDDEDDDEDEEEQAYAC
jgi:hypothetical protein